METLQTQAAINYWLGILESIYPELIAMVLVLVAVGWALIDWTQATRAQNRERLAMKACELVNQNSVIKNPVPGQPVRRVK